MFIDRRQFIKKVLGVGYIGGASFFNISAGELIEKTDIQVDDEYRKKLNTFFQTRFGFNLLNLFMVHSQSDFKDEEFALIRELGFNFVRLPMDYRCWTDENDPYTIKEPVLRKIDKAVELGVKYKIHICLNFHRAPGWTVAEPKEKMNLWEDEEAQNICSYHWKIFAERYKGISPEQLSFNLLNEPAEVSPDVHRKVIKKLLESIRTVDRERPILCDGRMWCHKPPVELADLGIIASFHMYEPFHLTHYKAEWAGKWDNVDVPNYPNDQDENRKWNRDTLWNVYMKPWKDLEEKGVPVFVGEFGCYNKTPHKSVINWLTDCLSLFQEAGWGWALWNFIGSFGPLNSQREDVDYEELKGFKVDRQMLSLLQTFAKTS